MKSSAKDVARAVSAAQPVAESGLQEDAAETVPRSDMPSKAMERIVIIGVWWSEQ